MIDTQKLYHDVMEKLRFEPNIHDENLTIAIRDDGIVILGGAVPSYTEKRLAEEAVRKVHHVRGIANEIQVDLALAYKRNDADIAKAALDALKWTMFIPHKDIQVSVSDGILTLSGEVSYNYQRERAQSAVEDLYGIHAVSNQIQLRSEKKAENIKEKISEEIKRNNAILSKDINVDVDGDRVSLSGNLRTFSEAKEARNIAWSIPGVHQVTTDFTISTESY